MPTCSGCNTDTPKTNYTASQLKKKGKRKCKICIGVEEMLKEDAEKLALYPMPPEYEGKKVSRPKVTWADKDTHLIVWVTGEFQGGVNVPSVKVTKSHFVFRGLGKDGTPYGLEFDTHGKVDGEVDSAYSAKDGVAVTIKKAKKGAWPVPYSAKDYKEFGEPSKSAFNNATGVRKPQ